MGCLESTPATAAGEISVRGTTILRDGRPWVAKGVSIVGRTAPAAVTRPGGYTQARQQFGAQELMRVREFGADLVRFQVSQGGSNPQSSIYSPDYLNEVRAAVSLARSMGFSVIVCVDGERSSGLDERGMPSDKTRNAWRSLAPLFASDRGVMLELFNEPQPDGPDAVQPHDWTNWQAAMQPLVDEIRSLGARNVILADGLYWAQMLTGAPDLNDPLSQIVYAIHPYFSPRRLADRSAWFDMFGRFATRHAVLATEWGAFSFDAKCNEATPQFAVDMLDYLRQQKIGLVGWAFDFPRTLADANGNLTNYDGFRCGPQTSFGPGELLARYFRSG